MNKVTVWLMFACVVYQSATTALAAAKCSTFMDVGFLLDSSGSIKHYYNHEKKFLIALTNSLDISKLGSHVGVITFSNVVRHSIKMNSHYDMKSFSYHVNKIPLINSITRIDLALKMAKNELFQATNGARSNTRKLLILLTDGVQSRVSGAVDPTLVANELRKMGVTVMAVGMGPGVNKAELNRITNGHAYTASTFNQLVSEKFIKKLTGETCKVSKEPVPVDGRWGPWGAYTKCNKKCGGGTKSRRRSCIAPKHGGKPCAGGAVENTKCNTQPCPVDGRWGPWGAYTKCSKKCGGGTKSRRRSCIAPKNGGKPCAGGSVENTKCNTEACPDWTPVEEAFPYIHVDRSKRPYRVTVTMTQFGGRPTATGQIDGTNGPIQTGYVIFPDDRRYNFWYYMEEAVIYWDHDKGKTTNIWRGLRGGRVAYVLNGKNDCWWTCKGGPCAKICGSGGYCCRKGWKGCPSDMTAVAKPNYHSCIRYKGKRCAKKMFDGRPREWRTSSGKNIKWFGGYWTVEQCKTKCVTTPGCQEFRVKKNRDVSYNGCVLMRSGTTRSGELTTSYEMYKLVECSGQGPATYTVRVPYVLNGKNNCWWTCKGGPCAKKCGSGGYCCRKGWGGCPSDMTAVAKPNYHTCIRYKGQRPATYTVLVPYVLNGKNDCWWTCKGGPCAKKCGSGGYCCRKGWGGCPSDMTAVAKPNYHTCIRYKGQRPATYTVRVPYVLNGKNDCWWTCKGGPCAKKCGSGGYCCRKGWGGCPSDMTAVAKPNYHTCIRYKGKEHVTFSVKVPYVLNAKNNCWWTCKGGPCAKICGSGGYCCRKGWKGCPSDMTAISKPNYHTCIKYRQG